MSYVPRACLIAVVFLSAGLPAAGALASAPQAGQAAVLFDPRLKRADLATAAAAAGVDIVRFGALPGSMVVDLGSAGGRERLRAAGAVLVADPIVLGGCATRGRD